MESIKPFEKIALDLAYRHSISTIFNDFLDMVICALSGQRMEEEYLKIISRYSKNEQLKFSELFGEMALLMDDGGQGYFDVLGEFFMIHITRGLNGQFFTPQHITDMMAIMTCGSEKTVNQTICDPSCGSGRTLLSAAKVLGKNNFFYAADLDNNCAKMAAINFCLNGLRGQIGHMNTLSYELYNCYEVYYDSERLFVPTIRIIPNDKSVFYTNPNAFKKAVESSRKQNFNKVAQLDLFS